VERLRRQAFQLGGHGLDVLLGVYKMVARPDGAPNWQLKIGVSCRRRPSNRLSTQCTLTSTSVPRRVPAADSENAGNLWYRHVAFGLRPTYYAVPHHISSFCGSWLL